MSLLDDALNAWSNRIPMTPGEKELFSSFFRGRGFYMADVWEKTFLERMKESLASAIEDELAFGDWLPKAEALVSSFGGGTRLGLYSGEKLSMSYADLVFRNATQAAMAGGRYASMFSKDGMADAAYWRYCVIDDKRLRPEHRALKGLVFAKKDADGRIYLPPCDHNAITGEMLVTTPHGYVMVRDVSAGDMVLTHAGRYRRVNATARKLVRGKRVRNLFLASGRILRITDEHPVLGAFPLDWKRGEDLKVGDVLFEHGDEASGREYALLPDPKDAPAVHHKPGVAPLVVDSTVLRPMTLSVNLNGNLLVREGDVENEAAYRKLCDDFVPAGPEDTEEVLLAWREILSEERGATGRHPLARTGAIHHPESLELLRGIRSLSSEVVVVGAPRVVGAYAVRDGHGGAARPDGEAVLLGPDGQRAVPETVSALDRAEAAAALPVGNVDQLASECVVGEVFWHSTTILSIVDEAYAGELVDLSVDDDESFVAEGVIVSNCRCYAVDVTREEIDDEGWPVRRGSTMKKRWTPPGDWNTDRVAQLVPDWILDRQAA